MARLCKQQLKSDPFSGTLYVFCNRRGTAIKVLAYDGSGFWLCHRRLSAGRFRFWPVSATEVARKLAAHEFQLLIMGGDPTSGKAPPRGVRCRCWRKLCGFAAAEKAVFSNPNLATLLFMGDKLAYRHRLITEADVGFI